MRRAGNLDYVLFYFLMSRVLAYRWFLMIPMLIKRFLSFTDLFV